MSGKVRFTIVLAIVSSVFFGLPAYILIILSTPGESGRAEGVADKSPFHYRFLYEGILEETGSPEGSTSPFWWLDSGGYLIIENNVGKTWHGSLPSSDYWREAYARTSWGDTAGGYYPQNIFRLFTKDSWQNLEEEIYFRIDGYNAIASSNRNESNGVLILARYQDEDNLYYIGIRVDGYIVVKKKIGGIYHTLSLKRIFPGIYNRRTNPIVLPFGLWIGLRARVETLPDEGVRISAYTDIGRTGNWTIAVEEIDRGIETGSPHDKEGRAGIRSDFMDVSFDDFRIRELD